MKFNVQIPSEFKKAEGLERVIINGKRHYMVDGVPLPSVTTILSSKEKPEITAWRNRVGHDEADRITRQAAFRGKGMHELAEQYLLGNEILHQQHLPDAIERFEALKPALNRIGTVFGIEQQLYSKVLGAAGTADLLAEYEGVPSVVDFKTARRPKREDWIHDYFKQESIYGFMAFELAKLHLPQIVTLVVVDDTMELQVFKQRARPWLDKAIVDITEYQKSVISS